MVTRRVRWVTGRQRPAGGSGCRDPCHSRLFRHPRVSLLAVHAAVEPPALQLGQRLVLRLNRQPASGCRPNLGDAWRDLNVWLTACRNAHADSTGFAAARGGPDLGGKGPAQHVGRQHRRGEGMRSVSRRGVRRIKEGHQIASSRRRRGRCALYAAWSALVMLRPLEGRSQCAGTDEFRSAPELPGYLHTDGSQIVDSNGNSVRIVSIGWNGMSVVPGQLDGLDGPFKGIEENLAQIRKAGFNAVRISWTDASLRSPQDMATYRQLVRAAGSVRIRIIFDHHQNEGTASAKWACAGQQVNGLWFDRGPGTDGSNGCGDRGTVSAADFQQNSASFAGNWAGNPTVIGFDLDNEPLTVPGHINWGEGGPTDIRAMCTNVGNAILAVDPGALI